MQVERLQENLRVGESLSLIEQRSLPPQDVVAISCAHSVASFVGRSPLDLAEAIGNCPRP
jgi:hypothetical protein